MIDHGREVNHPALRKALESPTPRPGRRHSARVPQHAVVRVGDGQLGAPETRVTDSVGSAFTGAPTE